MSNMRYRALSAAGDYVFGNGLAGFLINDVQAVAQAILTRMNLNLGEWFLDTADGTPWDTQILGKYTSATYDMAIRSRILGTQNVLAIADYSSNLSPQRVLSVNVTVVTQFSVEPVQIPTVFINIPPG